MNNEQELGVYLVSLLSEEHKIRLRYFLEKGKKNGNLIVIQKPITNSSIPSLNGAKASIQIDIKVSEGLTG